MDSSDDRKQAKSRQQNTDDRKGLGQQSTVLEGSCPSERLFGPQGREVKLK